MKLQIQGPDGKTYEIDGDGDPNALADKFSQEMGWAGDKGMAALGNTAKIVGTAAIQGAGDTADTLYRLGPGLPETGRDIASWLLKKTGLRPEGIPGKTTVPSELAEKIGIPTDPSKIGVPMTGLRKDIASGVRTATGVATMGAGPVGAITAGLGSGVGQELGGETGSFLGSILTPIIAGRVLNVVGRRANPPPTREALNRQAAAAYDDANRAGVVFNPQATQNMVIGMADDLGRQGLRLDSPAAVGLYPQAANTMRLVGDDLSLGPLTLERAEILRRNINAAQSAANDARAYADARLVSRIKTRLDRFVSRAGPEDVITGDPAAGIAALRTARDAYSRSAKAETLETLIDRATLGKSQYSVSGIENALRAEFRTFAKRGREMRFFSPDEQAAIRRVSQGSLAGNTLRYLGKMAPTGPLPIVAALGAENLSPMLGLSMATTGIASRLGATAMTKGRAGAAVDTALRGYRYTQPLSRMEQEMIRSAVAASGLELAQ
jgi:hypothetical protein